MRANPRPAPLLFLAPATGGGHLAAATAVAQAVERRYPGRYAPVICDPLAWPGSAWPARLLAGCYGYLIRYLPLIWGLLYRATDSPLGARLAQRAATSCTQRVVTGAVAACQPALIVSFHPLTGQAAIRAREAAAAVATVVTVITDLGPPHATWTAPEADWVVPASQAGVPVAAPFLAGQPGAAERAARRGQLGHPGASFLVLLVGGAEGAGKLARRAAAIVRRLPDVDVAVICGRNRLLRRRLGRLAARYGGRLSVHGFVTDMASWLRAADVVATKAGPATIAEAACCGTAMVLTCHLPGQERNNVGIVTGAGAGVYWPRISQLTAGIGRLREDIATLASMRAAAARLARPLAADRIATLIAELASPAAPAGAAIGDQPRSLVLSDGHDG